VDVASIPSDRNDDLVVTQERKVVVFSQWRRILQLAAWACGDILARNKTRALFFTGQESQRRRTENIVAFHDDPDARVLFATDAGGVGLNLQRAASCCINLELPRRHQKGESATTLAPDRPVESRDIEYGSPTSCCAGASPQVWQARPALSSEETR
jgi:hypothetical protein